MMKRILCLLLCMVMVFGTASLVQADTTTAVQAGEDQLEEEAQFPFLAQTDELAVNVRRSTSTKAQKVGRLERGTLLTVLSAEINGQGEVWYQVELADGTQGYIRSDLLVRADEAAIEEAAAQAERKTTKSSSSGSGQYIGNKNTRKFHRPSCHTLPKQSNRVYFKSRDKAISSGYVPCKNCNP